MGSVGPSDADLCIKLAATQCWANGGLYWSVGSTPSSVDSGLSGGTIDFTPPAERGKMVLLK